MKLYKMMVLGCVVILSLLLAACGGGGSGATAVPSNSGTPADAVKGFMEAIFSDSGDATAFVCTANAADAQAMLDGLAGMKEQLTATGATLDLSGLTYTTQNESGDKAEVVLGGSIKASVQGVDQDIPMGEGGVVPLSRENGAWKICGA